MAETSVRSLKSLSQAELWALKIQRWKARTDLGYLCREILGYRDVMYDGAIVTEDDIEKGCPDTPIHQPVIDLLQKFPVPTPEQFEANDKLVGDHWVYKPITSMMKLQGKRRVLLLDPRGHLKTTINIISHTIQWIINYPDIAMLLIQSTDAKSMINLSEIKQHFQGNKKFRALFPEHCPTNKEFGTNEKFTTPARGAHVIRKEPTVMTGSIEKGAAGLHVDVMKFSDIVEPATVRGIGLQKIKTDFYMAENLLVSPRFWIDMEGTTYHGDDLYAAVQRTEANLPPEKRQYKIHVRGIYVKDVENPVYNAASLKLKDKLDAKGNKLVLWPARFTPEHVAVMQVRDPFTFATQQLNDPSAVGGETYFPVDDQYPKWISQKDYAENVKIAYREICVDTAETTNDRSNYTAITVGAFSDSGRLFIEEIIHGRWLPDEVAQRVVLAAMRHRTTLRRMKIEKTGFVRGWESTLRRIMDVKGIYFPIELFNPNNKVKKEEKILFTLQAPYKTGDLRFVLAFDPRNPENAPARSASSTIIGINQPAWMHLLSELQMYPSARSDDILDSLCSFYENKSWFGREQARPTYQQVAAEHWTKALDIGMWNEEEGYTPVPAGYTRDGNFFKSQP